MTTTVKTQLRCAECGKLLAEIVGTPYLIRCPRCKATNEDKGAK